MDDSTATVGNRVDIVNEINYGLSIPSNETLNKSSMICQRPENGNAISALLTKSMDYRSRF